MDAKDKEAVPGVLHIYVVSFYGKLEDTNRDDHKIIGVYFDAMSSLVACTQHGYKLDLPVMPTLKYGITVMTMGHCGVPSEVKERHTYELAMACRPSSSWFILTNQMNRYTYTVQLKTPPVNPVSSQPSESSVP